MAKKHAALLALPPPVLQALDNDLRKGRPTKELAAWLHAQGYMKDTSAPSLGRELRAYRKDCIAIPEAARVTSIVRSPNPETQRLLLKRAEQWDAAASWQRLIQNAEARYWSLEKKFKDSPIPPDSLRRAANELSKMYQEFNEFLMETGVVRRVPRNQQHMHIVASQIQIHTADDVGQVIQALTTWLAGNEERLPHYTVAALEDLVTRLRLHNALGDLRELGADDPPPTPEDEQRQQRQAAHLLAILNGEEPTLPEPTRVPAADDEQEYSLTYVEDPDDAPRGTPLDAPPVLLERMEN